ncbi:MAG: thioredoxin domain-containing protein [Planctomycetota bacterium]|nr:thioredoxin domain-containing protein [Planctomycetota bacterium]
MPNKLAGSTSPYLLQHQNNPVQWHPWGNEALEKARLESRPIFLSIGYAACHWCHVMEHESFENQTIAAYLNEHFVSIKVDREQRPDLDHIYMQTVQMLTGSGGWPMSVFLTPDMKPFYGGTYWPPERRWGRPGFLDVLQAIVDAWKNKRESLLKQSDDITENLRAASKFKQKPSESSTQSDHEIAIDESILWNADKWLIEVFDANYGGFGGAPKFPHAMDIRLLIQLQTRRPTEQRLHVISKTLDSMADGGIYDHLGGGFARYSVDEKWLVPHFEKMLYDNALLAMAYLDGFLLTGNPRYRQVVCETLDYVLADLTDEQGGFYCTRDADSEGVEGKFYVWSREEILDILGMERGDRFCEAFGVTFGGNFEGKNILHHPEPLASIAKRIGVSLDGLQQELELDKKRLLAVRGNRIWPGLDDKVLCSWNALMISAMAKAGAAFAVPRYLEAAESAANFIHASMTKPDCRLYHAWRNGTSEIDGFLEDYSYLADALVTLFECSGDAKHIDRACSLVKIMDDHFHDVQGGFFFTASDSEALITRYKDQHDGSVPSGNAMAATALVKLARLTGDARMKQLAEETIEQASYLMHHSPGSVCQMLIALDHLLGPSTEMVYVTRTADGRRRALEHAFAELRPRTLIVLSILLDSGDNSLSSTRLFGLAEGRENLQGASVVLYQCSDGTCQAPMKI